jgi:hypothetical protein
MFSMSIDDVTRPSKLEVLDPTAVAHVADTVPHLDSALQRFLP